MNAIDPRGIRATEPPYPAPYRTGELSDHEPEHRLSAADAAHLLRKAKQNVALAATMLNTLAGSEVDGCRVGLIGIMAPDTERTLLRMTAAIERMIGDVA